MRINKEIAKKLLELTIFIVIIESIVMSVLGSPKHLILAILAYYLGSKDYSFNKSSLVIIAAWITDVILSSTNSIGIWAICISIIFVIYTICKVGKYGNMLLTGFIISGLLVYFYISTYYYTSTNESITGTFKNDNQISLELANTREINNTVSILNILNKEETYKNNLYSIIENIKEDKKYMLDIDGTEQTKWEKIGYLESVAIEFLGTYGEKGYKSITTAEIYDTEYVNKSIEKYKGSKTGV